MAARRLLESSRLRLEPITVEHADEVWQFIDDERMWDFFPSLRPASRDALRTLYRRWSVDEDPDEIRENWVCRDKQSGLSVGTMQATIFPRHAVAYIAYGIFVPFQRTGYGREAVAAVLSHLRQRHKIMRIFAEMDTRNEASYKLVESLGFRRVETRRAVERGHGIEADEYLYELAIDS